MSIADKLTQIAENTPKVYEAGKAEGIEQGKQEEYDAFWDAYQNNGERYNYQYCFAGRGWNSDNFKPKYDIRPETINTCFHYFGNNEEIENAVDFVEVFDKRGLVFDTSNCTNFMSAFMWAKIKRLGIIDARKDTQNLSSTFGYGEIQTIEKLIVCEDNGFTNNTFQNQSALENITFEGVIAKSGLNLQWSKKLSKASIESIMTHLDMNNFVDGRFLTLSKAAVDKAFEETEGANDGSNSYDWITLTANAYNLGGWETVLV